MTMDVIGVHLDKGRLVWGSFGGTDVRFGHFFAVRGESSMLDLVGTEQAGQGPVWGYGVLNYVPPNLCRIEGIHDTVEDAEARCLEQSHACAIVQLRNNVIHPTPIGGIPFGRDGYPSWFQGWDEDEVVFDE